MESMTNVWFAWSLRVKFFFRNVVMNLLAGVIGFLVYALLGLTAFAQSIPFTPITELKLEYVLYAIILGVIGALVAISVGTSMQLFGRVMWGP